MRMCFFYKAGLYCIVRLSEGRWKQIHLLYLHLKLPCYLPSPGLAEEVDLHWLEAPRSLATPEVTIVLPGDVNRPIKAFNNAISYANMLYYVDVFF